MTNPVIEEIQALRKQNRALAGQLDITAKNLRKAELESLDFSLKMLSQLTQKRIALAALEKAYNWFNVAASCYSAEQMGAQLREAISAIYAESEKAEAGLASIKRGMMPADVENADQDSPAAGGDAAGSQS